MVITGHQLRTQILGRRRTRVMRTEMLKAVLLCPVLDTQHLEVDGRVIVVTLASDGTKISCGRLGSIPSTSVDTYPGYEDYSYHPRGWVAVRQKQDESCNAGESTLSFHYFLSGLGSGSGGAHIHAGTTCANAGGHFWTLRFSLRSLEREYAWTATGDSLTIANFEVQAAKDITDVSSYDRSS